MRLAMVPPAPSPDGIQGPYLIQVFDYVLQRPQPLMLNDGDVIEFREQLALIRRSYGVGIYEITGWAVEGLCYNARLVTFVKRETSHVEP
jgi:hypothetical protein